MKRTSLTGIVVLLSLVLATLQLTALASSPQRQKNAIVSRIKASPDVHVYGEHQPDSPLQIQLATAKEISGEDYRLLVGETSSYFRQTTFPQVTLLNVSTRIIKSFSVAVESSANKRGYVVISPELAIAPNSAYIVGAAQWVRSEKIHTQKGDKFVDVWQKPGLDSSKSWIPGASSDLKIIVCMVEFDDGSKWLIPSGSKRE